MTDNECVLRDALTETLAFISGLLAKDHYGMVELAITNGPNIERRGLEALRNIETTLQRDALTRHSERFEDSMTDCEPPCKGTH